MKIFLSIFLLLAVSLESKIHNFQTPVVKYLKPYTAPLLNSGLEEIDAIYVINLDERKEKWSRMNLILKKHHLFPNRFSSINGWKMPKTALSEVLGPYQSNNLGPGRIGCILSHLSVIRDALNRNFDVVWIMEDDICIKENPRILDRLIRNLTQIDRDWDIFFTDLDSKNPKGEIVPSLGSHFRPDGIYPPLDYFTNRKKINAEFMEIRQRFGAYSYIVSRKGLQKLYHYLTHVYLWTAYDVDMHYAPGIKEYASIQEIVTIWHQSTISDTTTPVGSSKC